MWYGPYQDLPAGNYVVYYRLKVADNSSQNNILTLDVSVSQATGSCSTGQKVSTTIKPIDFRASNEWQTFALPVEIKDCYTSIEFRGMNFIGGITDVYLDYINVVPTDIRGFYSSQFTITPAGDVNIAGKLTANEVDPPYKIDGIVYATYALSTVGLKEETVGKVDLEHDRKKGIFFKEIDFGKAKKGSDLWLFSQITAFGKDWDDLVVILTPEGRAQVWYRLLPEENKLVIYANKPVKVSYRLIAPRFDWPERNTNIAKNQNVPALHVR